MKCPGGAGIPWSPPFLFKAFPEGRRDTRGHTRGGALPSLLSAFFRIRPRAGAGARSVFAEGVDFGAEAQEEATAGLDDGVGEAAQAAGEGGGGVV